MLCSQTCCTTARVLLTVRLTSQNYAVPDEPELCRTRPVGTDALCLPRADFPILRPYVAPYARGVLPLSVRSPVLLLSPVSCSPSSSSRRGLRAKNTLRFALLRVDHLRAGLRAQGGDTATQQSVTQPLPHGSKCVNIMRSIWHNLTNQGEVELLTREKCGVNKGCPTFCISFSLNLC